MRDESDRPINPEIGNSYLYIVGRVHYNARGRILYNRTRERSFATTKCLVGVRSALSGVLNDKLRILQGVL